MSSSTCPTLEVPDDRFDGPAIVAGIRFHNLCLPGQGGVVRRPEIWRIETANPIGFQRGDDRFVVINKAAETYRIRNLPTSLRPGSYKDLRRGWLIPLPPSGELARWGAPGRSALMFVRTSD